MPQAVDYDALAAQHGGSAAAPAVDYDALAQAHGGTPTFSTTNQKDAAGNATVDPNTLGTVASHFGQQINPVPVGQMIPFPKALGGAGYDAPVKAVKGILAAQGVPLDNAKTSYEQGDYGGAAIHLLNYLLPIIGPVLDKSGNEFRAGKSAAGLGDALGLAANLVAPKVVGDVAQAAASSTAAQRVADAADAGANARVVDVIAPKVGANKVRFGNAAADVAPTVARETTGLSRSGVADSVAAKLEDATAALDDAADSRLNAKSFQTQPVLDALAAKRGRLTSEAVEGSQFTPQSGVNRPPIGQDVVPGPNAARVAQIDQAMGEVKQLGPVARYEALRRIREAYDGPAKAVYSPAMTTDYMTAQGGKMGAADVTSALRDHLATLDPNTAAANADYSLWKKASDVLTAAEETDRVRPTVGRTLMARGLGAMAGGGMDGGVGAAVGAMVAPVVERAMTGMAPALKLIAARQMTVLADALRAGDIGRVKATLVNLQRMVPVSNAARSSVAPLVVPTVAQGPQ